MRRCHTCGQPCESETLCDLCGAPPFRRRFRVTLLELAVALCATALLVPGLTAQIRPRAQARLTACRSNLKNIGTALDMYASDWHVYPGSLGALTPNYLKILPECPKLGIETYSRSYAVSRWPAAYTFTCEESHLGPNYIYTSRRGLVEKP
ncbi:MAG: DUF1559 domain-containing protein [Candidatus Eremiobacterota bacterium]